MNYINQRVIFAVAQEPFSSGPNKFCSLVPLLHERKRVSLDDFPVCGHVWWKVLDKVEAYATPGRLISGVVEEAYQKKPEGDPNRMDYQVKPGTVRLIDETDFIEIVRVDSLTAVEAVDLVNVDAVASMDHYPTPIVMARWKDQLVGPLKSRATSSSSGSWNVEFSAARDDSRALFVPMREGLNLGIVELQASVSLDSRIHREDSDECQRCLFAGILPDVYAELIASNHESRLLKSDREVISEFAKQCLSRKDRQALVGHLERLGEVASSEQLVSYYEVLDSVQRRSIDAVDELEELTEAFVESGLLDETLQREVDQRLDARVGERREEIRREVRNELEGVRREVVSARSEASRVLAEKNGLDEELRNERERRVAALDREIEEGQAEFENELRGRLDSLARREEYVESRESVVRKLARDVFERQERPAQSQLSDFLVLLPLLQECGLAMPQPQSIRMEEEALPPSVMNVEAQVEASNEREFMDFFVEVLARKGLCYQNGIPARMHIIAKTEPVVVVYGESGSGKSSLLSAYARALNGSTDSEGSRCFRAAVGSRESELGLLSSFDHRLGRNLEKHLELASREVVERGAEAGVYLVCLDVLEGASIPELLDALLTASEGGAAPGESPISAAPGRRSELASVPRAVRFVLLVNASPSGFERRALVRCGAVVIGKPRIAELLENPMSTPYRDEDPIEARAVSIGQLESWCGNFPEAGKSIDRLREWEADFSDLGLRLLPASIAAYARFVANSRGLLSEDEASDMHIAQVLLGGIPILDGHRAWSASKNLGSTLKDLGYNQSSRAIDELRRTSVVPSSGEELEDE